ncbi:Na(+)-translocating NADH-quinone reductase subunit A [compost metagenome]
MDIYPVHLLKSVLIEDIEMMEKLGIYEVVEEDFALCELVCTSKIKSQEIIRHGLDIIRKEFN